MPIRFACSNEACGKAIKAPDAAGGKRIRCPACGTVQTAPSPEGAEAINEGVVDLEALAAHEAAQPGDPRSVAQPQGTPPMATPKRAIHPTAGPAMSRWDSRIGKLLGVALLAGLLVVGAMWAWSHFSGDDDAGPTSPADRSASDQPGILDYPGQVIGSTRTGQRGASSQQLRQIHTALTLYAQMHDGRFPADLAALAEEGYLSTDALKSPAVVGRPAQSYQYIPGLWTSSPANRIGVYEPPVENTPAMVLRVGGQVESLSPQALTEALASGRQEATD